LVIILLTQKLVAIVLCQFNRVKGRAAHSLPLTRLNQRPFVYSDARLFEAVNVGEAPAQRLH
jgi:hypothetical protein